MEKRAVRGAGRPLAGRFPTRAAAMLLGVAAVAASLPVAQAQSDLRSSFPGRRVGGGTRGECASRLLAHLVPASSVFAPGQPRFLGVLEGPSLSPSPLEITFRPLNDRGAGSAPTTGQRRVLPASAPGITLFTLPAVKVPTVWESSYLCPGAAAAPAPADPLAFVAAEAPPARSLLLAEATKEDLSVQAALAGLRRSCGSSVPRQEVAAVFGLTDLITAQWPERIPVRCPA